MVKATQIKINCPNCNKKVIDAMHYPAYQGHTTSRISSGSKTQFYSVGERYEIMSDCKECGKTKKELRLIEKVGKETHEERIGRLKNAGIPTQFKG